WVVGSLGPWGRWANRTRPRRRRYSGIQVFRYSGISGVQVQVLVPGDSVNPQAQAKGLEDGLEPRRVSDNHADGEESGGDHQHDIASDWRAALGPQPADALRVHHLRADAKAREEGACHAAPTLVQKLHE